MRAWHHNYVTNTQHTSPTPVQVLAAQLRVKADKRLKRQTPADIRAIAVAQESRQRAAAKSA
jgi:hypothetical protein